MKKLGDFFVIVKQWGNQFEFFEGTISADKTELEDRCKQMNEDANARWKKNYESSKRNLKRGPYTETVIYTVSDLSKAIESFGDSIADAHTEHDESY